MAYTPKAGKLVAFLVGSTNFDVRSVQVREAPVAVGDATPPNSDQVLVPSYNGRTYRISGAYDYGLNYHASPPDLKPGMTVTGVHAKPDGTLDYTSSAIVTEFNWTSGPDQPFSTFDAELRSTGALTYPAYA